MQSEQHHKCPEDAKPVCHKHVIWKLKSVCERGRWPTMVGVSIPAAHSFETYHRRSKPISACMFARTVLQYKGPHRFLFPYISSLTWAPKQHPRSNGEHFKPSSNSHAFPRNGHNEVTDTQTQIPLWLWQWTLNTEHCSNLTASLYYQLWGSPDANSNEKTTTYRQRLTRKSQKHAQVLVQFPHEYVLWAVS